MKYFEQLYSAIADCQNALDASDVDEKKESNASFLKRIDIATAIDRVHALVTSYEEWIKRTDDPTYHPDDTLAEHRGER